MPEAENEPACGPPAAVVTSPSGQLWCRNAPLVGQRMARNVMRQQPGVTAWAASRIEDEVTAFEAIFDDNMMKTILVETNREARRSKGDNWFDYEMKDMKAFIGLVILRGVYRAHNESLEELWSAEHGRSIFRATMPLYKFKEMGRYLRFDNRDTRNGRLARDKCAAVRLLIEGFVENSQKCYRPGENGSVTIDEQLYAYRGRCRYIQYMASKPAKYGLKFWALCDASTWFCWNLDMYTGKDDTRETALGEHVVLSLTKNLAGSGLNVTADNYYCTLALARRLLERNITLLGTVRSHRREVPLEMRSYLGRELYSSTFLYTPEESIQMTSYKAKRNKVVILLSSKHSASTVQQHEPFKLTTVLDYNDSKGGVDVMDKLVGAYSVKYKSRRWHVAVFCNILDISCVNAFKLLLGVLPNRYGNKSHKRRIFLTELGFQLTAEKRATGTPTFSLPPAGERVGPKRGRCKLCGRKPDTKLKQKCATCYGFCCPAHSTVVCLNCLQA